jgi:anti-anti-sigma factor
MAMRTTEGSERAVWIEQDGDRRCLHLAGVVNAAQARRLREEALGALAGSGAVTLDLARAEYLDGAALQVLLALRAELVRRGHRLQTVAMAPSIEDTLRAIGLAGNFGIESGAAAGTEGGEPA